MDNQIKFVSLLIIVEQNFRKQDKHDQTMAIGNFYITDKFSRYPWVDQDYLLTRFGKAFFYFHYTHVCMKKGTPYAKDFTNLVERLHSMGIMQHITWRGLPIEATDWGRKHSRLSSSQSKV